MVMKINLDDLKQFHFRLKDVDCDSVFTNDGSVEYKEFINQFKWYQREPSILSNYYSMVLLMDGVNKFANERFWTIMRDPDKN